MSETKHEARRPLQSPSVQASPAEAGPGSSQIAARNEQHVGAILRTDASRTKRRRSGASEGDDLAEGVGDEAAVEVDDPGVVRAAAEIGTSGPAGSLPHMEAIQRSFGKHDVSRIQAHTDGAAAAGARAIGAAAFAAGEHIAFAADPDLHMAAHEAAHVIQQRGGVQLAGGVGEVGDRYERHADEVADAVVRGESAEALLDREAPSTPGRAGTPAPSPGAVVQRVFAPVDTGVPSPASISVNWTDQDTDENYVLVHKRDREVADETAETGHRIDTWLLVERQRDGFRLWIDATTLEPDDLDALHRAARLDTVRSWQEVFEIELPSDDEIGAGWDEEADSDDDAGFDEMVFEQSPARAAEAERKKKKKKQQAKAKRAKTPKKRRKKSTPPVTAPSSSGDEDEDEPFEDEAPPLFVEPRGVGVAKQEKNPSAFAADVLLAPIANDCASEDEAEHTGDGEVDDGQARPMDLGHDGKYDATELRVIALQIANERPPTQFAPLQKSHTSAWTLIRAALASFAGRPLTDLLDFVERGLLELVDPEETQAPARKHARLALPESGFIAGVRLTRQPLHRWIDISSRLVVEYEVAYHKSSFASFGKKAGGRGEATAMAHLQEVETALAEEEIGTREELDQHYKDNFKVAETKKPSGVQLAREREFGSIQPTAVTDAWSLLDIELSPKLSGRAYGLALQHWFDLLHLAFPHVMPLIRAELSAHILDKPQTGKTAESLNIKKARELTGDLDIPTYADRNVQDLPENDLEGVSNTDLTARVRLIPIHEQGADGAPSTGEHTLDELEIRFLDLGNERVDTRFGTAQRSHTTAWTLIRAALRGFAGQPLADLYTYLCHGIDDLKDDCGGGAADADSALSMLKAIGGLRLSPVIWQRTIAQGLVEYVRLYHLTRAATFDKDPTDRPIGHGEATAMQFLRDNEAHLLARDNLYDTPERVIEKAQVLIDVEIDHADLPWRDYCRAVLHWEECLWLAFPTLMAVGGARIKEEVYQRELPDAPRAWADVPPLTPEGKKPATVSDLVACYLAERGGWHTNRHERLTLANPTPAAGARTAFHAVKTIGGGDCAFNGFALGLIGMVSQGALPRADVLDRLGGVSPRMFADLVKMGKRLDAPANARAIQLALAPTLRRIAVDLLDKDRSRLEVIEQDCQVQLQALIDKEVARKAAEGAASTAVETTGAGEDGDGEIGMDLDDGGGEAGEPEAPARNLNDESDLFDPSSSLGGAMRAVAASIDVTVPPETPDRATAIDAHLHAWAHAEGLAHYLAHMKQNGVWGGAPELAVLSDHFQVRLLSFTGPADAAAGAEGHSVGGTVPIRLKSPLGETGPDGAPLFTDAEAAQLLGRKLIVAMPDLHAPALSFPAALPDGALAELDANGGAALAARFGELVAAHQAPLLGMRNEGGHWSLVTTEGGAADLTSDTVHVDGAPRFHAWKSRTPPPSLQGQLARDGADATSRGRARQVPAEGTFVAADGRSQIAWATGGNGNCAFNGFAQVLLGLVAQDRLARAKLAPLGIADDELERLIADAQGAQTDRGASARVEAALAAPLRRLAIEELTAHPAALLAVEPEFIEEIRGRVYRRIGIPWRPPGNLFLAGSTLGMFLDVFGSEVAEQVLTAQPMLVPDPDAMNEDGRENDPGWKADLVDPEFARIEGKYSAWFQEQGVQHYLEDMGTDHVWGGGPELQALAAVFGVTVSIFKDGGNIVSRDDGEGSVGSAPADTFTEPELTHLRGPLDVIEGKPAPTSIFFRRRTRAEVLAAFDAHGEGVAGLRDKFLALYDQHCLCKEALPPEVGLFRHRQRDHWSAVSTDAGAYELNDPASYLPAEARPQSRVDSRWSGAYSVDVRAAAARKGATVTGEPGATSGGGGTAVVRFDRRKLNVPGVETSYADRMYGGAHGAFDLGAIDPGVDAKRESVGLVNAAHAGLTKGGGVCGAIYDEGDKAGAISGEIAAWKSSNGSTLPAGGAMSTSGGSLAGIANVIHAVGPNNHHGEAFALLDPCVTAVVQQAIAQRLTVIVFCNISSELFGFDRVQTANEILRVLERELGKGGHTINRIVCNKFPDAAKPGTGSAKPPSDGSPPPNDPGSKGQGDDDDGRDDDGGGGGRRGRGGHRVLKRERDEPEAGNDVGAADALGAGGDKRAKHRLGDDVHGGDPGAPNSLKRVRAEPEPGGDADGTKFRRTSRGEVATKPPVTIVLDDDASSESDASGESDAEDDGDEMS